MQTPLAHRALDDELGVGPRNVAIGRLVRSGTDQTRVAATKSGRKPGSREKHTAACEYDSELRINTRNAPRRR
jgi:hypothetical protein